MADRIASRHSKACGSPLLVRQRFPTIRGPYRRTVPSQWRRFMLLGYEFVNGEVAHCSRRCAVGGRALAPGESYYSALVMERGVAVRRDYAASAWSGPPEGAFAWWQANVTGVDGGRGKLAPQDVLLDLFATLAGEPAEAEFRYVLGLLLLRRRLVKLDETRNDAEGETLVLDCPRRDERFELRVAAPTDEKAAELERRLVELVYGGASAGDVGK
jgi:hypothetical protein